MDDQCLYIVMSALEANIYDKIKMYMTIHLWGIALHVLWNFHTVAISSFDAIYAQWILQ